MPEIIRILHLEDSLKDSELIQSIIVGSGIGHDYFITDNKAGFIKILHDNKIDIILSDFSILEFNGNEALLFCKKLYPRIPFIFVSGTIGEDVAINAMLNGATDYVLKHKLDRLLPAIKRALKERELQKRKKKDEQKLREKSDQIRTQFSELQKRAIELENSNKELEQFAYIASHDLQEPLRTISNYMTVFEEDYIDKLDENARKYLESVLHATNRMRMLIKGLLNFSLLSHNLEFQETDIKHLIGDVLNDIGSLINTTKSVIVVDDMPVLNIYEPLIRKVFQNLIANAVKFQKNGNIPHIHITSARIRDAWEFCVSDNGIGIEPEHYERVFNIFQRLHNNEEEYAGSGIGLANCKKIIQLHHGEIWIEPNANQGSRFCFTIPISIL